MDQGKPMNRKWKKKWIEALKSGEYKQCQEKLRAKSGRRYCCLGVLADIADPEGWEKTRSLKAYEHRGGGGGHLRLYI